MKSSSFRNLDAAKRTRLLELAKSGKYAQILNVKPDSMMPADRSTPLALSFAQQRLWFLAQMEGVSAAYHIPGGFTLRGDLNPVALVAALNRIVARHEALRTTFTQRDGQAVQIIGAADAGMALQTHDFSEIADAQERQGRLDQTLKQIAEAPFNLEQGPLIRAGLVRLSPREHILFFTMHHIVFDGWSMSVLMNEITALYSEYGRPGSDHSSDPLPPLRIQYPDYSQWQRAWLAGERQQRQIDYWQRTLAGIPTLLELPADRPRPTEQSHVGAYQELLLGLDLTNRLKAFSQRHGVTLYITLISSWAVLLGRLSGQEDLVIGSPTAGRNRSEIENLIGFFVNSLALRFELPPEQTVAGLLAQSKQRILDAQQYQDLPIERILDIVRPPRSLAHTPIFQVLFALQNAPEGKLEMAGVTMAPLSIEGTGTAKFDITFGLQEQDGEIAGAMEYTTALYDATTIARHLEHWRTLLEGMLVDDHRTLDRLPVLTAAHRRQILIEWNTTDRAYRCGCVHELFEAQVERTPGAIAVVHEQQQLTYGELNRRANRLAHHLRTLGVGPDDRVAICAERGLDMVIALLGTLKAGGAYVPLDPSYPLERLSFMLADSAPVIVLTLLKAATRDRLSAVLHAQPIPVLDLNVEEPSWARGPDGNPDLEAVGLSTRHLAYVIYTSGSTGRPKGVLVEHANVMNLIHAHVEHCALTATDRVLQFASFAFDASVEEIFPALTVGAAIVLRPAGIMAPDDEFLRFMKDMAITVAELPTAFWQQWALQPDPGRHLDGTLRLVVVGGEKAERRHVELWREKMRGQWLNTYGPTEATVYATSLMLDLQGELIAGEVPVGRPIANTQIYILDRHLQPVPIGVAGEIFIGGAGVARGYLNQAQLTAERFLTDPFRAGASGGTDAGATDAGRNGGGSDARDATSPARMYKTGDLGRWRADGTIEYLGRNDQQVKIRGFRIELGEIEARLAKLDGVREAVVLAREDQPGNKRLVGYVVPRTGAELSVGELRRRLATELPEYMVPSAIVTLQSLPLTPNGKLDRRALPLPEGDAYAARGYESPQGQFEEALAEIWSALLQRESVGRRDNFFELGGHSLLAMQLLSRIRQHLHIEIPLAIIFSQPILADLAAAVAQSGRAMLPGITPVDRDAPLAASFSQQLLWSLSQLEELSRAYNIHGGIRLHGELNREALAAALNRIVARHEALRTTFREHGGQAVPSVGAADTGLILHVRDLTGTSDAREQRNELRDLLTEEAHIAFDLARGPLIRALLLRLAAQEHVLFFTLHHIVSDGWSMGVLLNEITGLYGVYARGDRKDSSDPLPALPIQYRDYAHWQRGWLSGERLQRQTSYWRRTLAGIPASLELPTDRPRPARQNYAGAYHAVKFAADLSGRLRAFSQRHGVTLYTTLIASWAALLARLAGQDDVVIGSPIAGRGRSETENLIGFFINVLALRFQLQSEQTVAALIEQGKQQIVGAQQHQDLPFGHLLDIVQPPTSLAHPPIFQVMFAWQNVPSGQLDLPGVTVAPLDVQAGSTAKYDLSLSLHEVDGQIAGAMEYATALYDATTIERHIDQWRTLLEAMLIDDGQLVGRLSLDAVAGLGAAPDRIAVSPGGAGDVIARGAETVRSSSCHVTAFRETGRSAPLFFVHQSTGSCGYVGDMTPWIDADTPVYGLSPPGFEVGETPLTTVADMAAVYVAAIRGVQPRGPYRIAGFSAGGTIAYEIARQLLAGHETVGFLGLIDTHGNYADLSASLGKWARGGRLSAKNIDVAFLLAKLEGEHHSEQELRALSKLDSVEAIFAKIGAGSHLPMSSEAADFGRLIAVQSGIAGALIEYEATDLPITVDLYAASESLRDEPHLRWDGSKSRFVIHRMDGNHFSIMKLPRVMALAKALSSALKSSPGSREITAAAVELDTLSAAENAAQMRDPEFF